MKIIHLSICKDFDSSTEFDESAYLLADGVRFHGPDALAKLHAVIKNKRVLVLGHGYNSDRTGAERAYWEVAEAVNGFYDVAVFTYWPGSLFSPAFWLAWKRADDAGARIYECFKNCKAKFIDVQGHSLFARVCGWMKGSGFVPFRYLILFGAAIPRNSMNQEAKYYYALTFQFKKVFVFWSKNDGALKTYEAAVLWTRKALGLRGPDPDAAPNVTGYDVSDSVPDHSGYRKSKKVIHLWLTNLGSNKP